MSSPTPIWLKEKEAEALMPLGDAIDVLESAHLAFAAGRAANMARSHIEWGDSIHHAVGGAVEDLTGTKTWTYSPAGAQPLLILFDAKAGRLIGIVEAFALGKARTAATTGLGTRSLARPDAAVLALLGTGKQAIRQAEAVAAVRPLEEVRVFGRDAGRREDFSRRLQDTLEIRVSAHASPAQALAGAAIATAVTRAAEPFVEGAMLEAGTHVNAVGAIVPSRRELDASAVGRCAVVVADSKQQAREDSGELRAAADAGRLRWDDVANLGEVLSGARPGRVEDDEITLFKALGVGLADVALGAELMRRAESAGAGQRIGGAEKDLATTLYATNEEA